MSYGSSKRAFDNAFSICVTSGAEDSFAANLSYGLFALASTLKRERAASAAALAKVVLSVEALEQQLSLMTQPALPAAPINQSLENRHNKGTSVT